MSNLIKIGIDPSGTGTTAIVNFEDKKLLWKNEYTNNLIVLQKLRFYKKYK